MVRYRVLFLFPSSFFSFFSPLLFFLPLSRLPSVAPPPTLGIARLHLKWLVECEGGAVCSQTVFPSPLIPAYFLRLSNKLHSFSTATQRFSFQQRWEPVIHIQHSTPSSSARSVSLPVYYCSFFLFHFPFSPPPPKKQTARGSHLDQQTMQPTSQP